MHVSGGRNMKIEIIGEKCANCKGFTQYYCYNEGQILQAIDSGYCSVKSKNVRPGDRCKEHQYRTKQISRDTGKCRSCIQYEKFYCAWMEEKPEEIGCGYCRSNLKVVMSDGTCGEWEKELTREKVV